MRAACLVPAQGPRAARAVRAGSLCTGYGGLDLAGMAVLDVALA